MNSTIYLLSPDGHRDSFEIDSIVKEDYPEEEYNLLKIYDNL